VENRILEEIVLLVKFIYVLTDPSPYAEIVSLGQVYRCDPNYGAKLVNIEIKTERLKDCLELFTRSNKIKQINVWK
jgi:hypothetical protein